MVELALVEVGAVRLLDVLAARVPHEGQRDEEKDECATDAARVGDELLRILLEEDDYEHGS